jgi:hypothetical protein
MCDLKLEKLKLLNQIGDKIKVKVTIAIENSFIFNK